MPDSIPCRLYLLTILVETAIDLAIEGDLLLRLHEVDKGNTAVSKKMPVYLAIFALAQYVPSDHSLDVFTELLQRIPIRACSGCSVSA